MTAAARKASPPHRQGPRKQSMSALKVVSARETNQAKGSAMSSELTTPWQSAEDYQLDVWQRTILFWDILRQRADNMLEHERAGPL